MVGRTHVWRRCRDISWNADLRVGYAVCTQFVSRHRQKKYWLSVGLKAIQNSLAHQRVRRPIYNPQIPLLGKRLSHRLLSIRNADVAMWTGRTEKKEIAKTMTPRDYLHIATLGGAKALGMEDKVGSIMPCKLADLMLLRNDRLLFPILDDLAERVMVYAGIQGIDSVRV